MTTDYFSALAALRSEMLEHQSGQGYKNDLSVGFLCRFLHLFSEEAQIAIVSKGNFQDKDKIMMLQETEFIPTSAREFLCNSSKTM